MTRLVVWLVVGIIALSVLVSAGPTIVALANALAPLVLAVGLVIAVLRIVWLFTKHY
jgi:hypothetical protein